MRPCPFWTCPASSSPAIRAVARPVTWGEVRDGAGLSIDTIGSLPDG